MRSAQGGAAGLAGPGTAETTAQQIRSSCAGLLTQCKLQQGRVGNSWHSLDFVLAGLALAPHTHNAMHIPHLGPLLLQQSISQCIGVSWMHKSRALRMISFSGH